MKAKRKRQRLWEIYFSIRLIIVSQGNQRELSWSSCKPYPAWIVTTNICEGITCLYEFLVVTLMCICSQMFWGLSVYCGCNIGCLHIRALAFRLPNVHNTIVKSQLDCNHDNHSVVKATNLFLQWLNFAHFRCLGAVSVCEFLAP